MYRFALSTLILGAVASLIAGAERCSGAEPQLDHHGRLILRISREAIGPVQNQTFEREQAVDDLVLGTTVKGTAKTTAKCAVEPSEEEMSAGLRLVVSGTSVTET